MPVASSFKPSPTPASEARRVLIVDDDRDSADGLADFLALNDYEPVLAYDGRRAVDLCAEVRPSVAILDIKMNQDSGLDLVPRLQQHQPDLLCIMATAHVELETAMEAVRRGAYDYLRKPLHNEEALVVLDRAFERLRLQEEVLRADRMLRDAIESISEGFSLFDADDRLVLVNERYRKMNPDIAHLLQPGVSFDVLLRAAMAHRRIGEAEGADWLKQRLALHREATEPFEEQHADGRWVRVEDRRTHDGGYVGIRTDVTEAKRQREALQESERRATEAHELLLDALESSPDGIAIYDADDRLVMHNDKFRSGVLAGIADLIEPHARYEDLVRAAVGRDLVAVPDGDVEAYVAARLAHHRGGEGSLEVELANNRWMLSRERRMRDGGIIGTRSEITEQKLADAALRESEERFRVLAEATPTPTVITNLSDGLILFANREAERQGGEPYGCQLVGTTTLDGWPDPEERAAFLVEAAKPEGVRNREVRMRRPDGSMRWLLASAEEIVFEGRPALLTSYHDITEQKQAEERFHAIFDQAAVGIGLMTPGGRFLAVNKKLCELMRRDEATLLDLRFNDFTHPDDYEQCTAHMTSLVAGDISTFSSEMRFSPEEDVLLWGTLTVSAIRDQSSDRYALLGIVEDVTERKRAENAQQQSEDRLREAAKLAHLGYWVWDAIEDKCLFCSEECARIHGLTPEEYIDRTAVIDGEFLLVHPDDREEVQEKFRSLRSGQEIEIEYRVLTPEGEPRHVREVAKPVLDENGHVIQEHGTILDITDLRRSEEQLRQAQKMEAVGQLTGGVAHDFNNLLAIIQGNIAFLDRKLAEDDSLKALTAPTLRAVKRGASLTQRLLAFSRQQSLDVQPIDVGQLVTELGEMLDRSLGEDISMKIHVAPELWMCEVDSGQLEQAIVNLANNARDALVEGGELIIDVSNACLTDERVAEQVGVAAGEYVAISVTDDGPGMPAEVREKIFDPFYTTKEVGKGTGLGLSMVYGFLQQSGGQVIVESEPGQGTTFRLYLPRLILGEIEQDENAGDETVPAASELVLLVEDDEDLRAMTRMLLMDLGYRVIEAGSGSQAHDMLTTIDKVDLLLTDVVLPGGMSGPEFADAALQTNPDLKVAYMSGYMGDALERYGELRDSVLIQKPFDGEGLGRQLRKVLGGD